MNDQTIRFDNGAAYERFMGRWSQLVGDRFIDWLSPKPGLRWLDVGCGNGAFTEMIVKRCAPSAIAGIDPSEGQLAYARSQPSLQKIDLRQADAMALPFGESSFDVAVMPLVIFFVPIPAKGVAEMVRVLRPGGNVAAYAWDMDGGGFPYEALHDEMRTMGITVPTAPSSDASKLDVMRQLWADAGLTAETLVISVKRTFADFEDYWTTVRGGPTAGSKLAAMSRGEVAELQARMKARLPTAADGTITYEARANAIKGIRT